MSDRELLFNRHSFSNLLDGMSTQIQEKVHGETREYLLNVNEEEYVAHLISEFAIAAVLIDKEHIEVAQQFEKEIQVSDYGLPLTPKRNFLTFAIPFTGERELFFISRLRLLPTRHGQRLPKPMRCISLYWIVVILRAFDMNWIEQFKRSNSI